LQTEAADLAPEGGGYVSYDATDNNVLDGVAMGTRDGGNLLAEQAAPFVHLGLVATGLTAIFPFPCHDAMRMNNFCKDTNKQEEYQKN